jgi:hypothetical protein
MAHATADGVIVGAKLRYSASRWSDTGTVTMARSDVVTTRLKTYEASPPSLTSLRGRSGAPAQIASTTRATSVGRGRSRVRAMATAMAGAATYMAMMDFPRRIGRRQSQTTSFTVTPIPVAKSRTAIEILRGEDQHRGVSRATSRASGRSHLATSSFRADHNEGPRQRLSKIGDRLTARRESRGSRLDPFGP